MIGRRNQTDSIAMKAEGHRESLANNIIIMEVLWVDLEVLQDCEDVFVLPH
jgi:hypothetical protein